MRKPRDYDAELKALEQKARLLKDRKLTQLGELVTATGADALMTEELAGTLLAAVATIDAATKEGWRKRGAAFFQGATRNAGNADRNKSSIATRGSGKQPAAPDAGTA